MRILAVAVLGATGLSLLIGGIPLRRVRLDQRVDPYLGRPDGGWSERGISRPKGILMRMWTRVGSSDRELAGRLRIARSGLDPPAFRIQQLVWGAAGLGLVIVLVLGTGGLGLSLDARGVVVLGGIALVSGVLGRDWLLSRQVSSKAHHMNEEMPVAIDLMTLTLMAGGSVPAACERVAATLPQGVGRELGDALEDMRGGRSATVALRDVAARVDHRPLNRLIEALCAGLERGTPLADVLRAQAHDIRDERRRHLIELGGRREVAMLIPVVFLILPTVVAYALFPALASLDLLVP